MSFKGISTGGLIAIAATSLFLTICTSGLLSASQSMPSTGIISSVSIGVYTDSACTINCTSINWGSIAPGNSTTRTVYVKNTGSLPVTLSMSTASWNPANANSYLVLTWNRASYSLAAGSSVQATFTLSASASAGILTSFSFNAIITGSEQ